MGIMIFPYSHQHLLLYVFLIIVTLANLENSSVATGLEKVSLHSNPKERQAKECSNYRTIALMSHASKVMLKILQARLQQYMNHELQDVQASFRKGRGNIDQIANIRWIMEKARVGNLISGSSAFSKTSLNIWKFTIHVLLKPGLENFERYFTSV